MLKINCEFDKVYKECYDENALVDKEKAEFIYNQCKLTEDLQGCTAELGVYRGHTSKMILLINKGKPHYCYDTFRGVIKAESGLDNFYNGEFSAPFQGVKQKLESFNNLYFRIGVFPDTFKEHNKSFCFVHSDMDTYFGVKATYEYFASRIVTGGKILFDDYDGARCQAVRKSIQELMKDNKEFSFTTNANQICFTKN